MVRVLFATLLFLTVSFHPASAQSKNWQQEWNRVLALAKNEKVVVVSGPPNTAAREGITAKFKERFGIAVQYIGGGSGRIASRLEMEQQAGISTVDVVLGGPTSAALVFYPKKMLSPVRPLLLLPEVVDPSKWKRGKLWFADPDDKYLLRLFSTVRSIMHVNTKYVKVEDFKSIKDLIDPRWKGKIAVASPLDPGQGSNTAAEFYVTLGADFVKRFYIDQKPGISHDRHQLGDWLAHGTYPITTGARDEDVQRLRDEGLPVQTIYHLPDWPGALTGGSGFVMLLKNPPHPNAARIFLNWIASKEGLEIFARASKSAPTRDDIDESYLPRAVIPVRGVNYFDSNDWKFTVTTRAKVMKSMKKLLQQ